MPQNDTLCLVINLDRSTQRWEDSRNALTAQGFFPLRVSGFDGRTLDQDALIAQGRLAKASGIGYPLSPGEMGCSLSHMKALDHFLSTEAPYAIICEDDADPVEGADAIVQATLDWLATEDKPFSIVHLSPPHRLKHCVPVARLEDHATTILAAHYLPITATTLLWSRAAAEAFLKMKGRVSEPFDWATRDFVAHYGMAYALTPSIFFARESQSVIDSAGQRAKSRRGFAHWRNKQGRLIRQNAMALLRRWGL